MATPNVGEIVTTTIQKRNRELADNVSDNNAVLSQMKKKGRTRTVDGGEKIYEEISFADNTNAQSYDGYDTLSTNAQQVLDTAEFAWKQYAVAVVISGREKMQNSGRERMIDLITARIDNAKASLRNKIALGIYSDGTGNGSKDITGFASAIPTDPTTGTYGGINRANFTFWRPAKVDPAVTPTSTTIQASMTDLWVATCRDTDKPSLILSDNVLYAMYWESLTPLQRFTDPDTAQLGFENVKFNTAPVVLDGGVGGNCPASTMLYLNTDHLSWRPHAERNFVPLNPEARDPVNQDATVRYIAFMGNMTCSCQFLQGRLIGT